MKGLLKYKFFFYLKNRSVRSGSSLHYQHLSPYTFYDRY